MKNTFNDWYKLGDLSLETVIDYVLTDGKVETLNSDIWLLDYMGNKISNKSILDFGCGIGRNIFDFSTRHPNWKFCGYDNSNMIVKAKEYSNIKFNKTIYDYANVEFISDWDALKTRKYDCIYATIVFQHIHEKDLNIYLKDIKQMTNKLIVSGRRFNDDTINGKYKNTWQILENNGYHPSNTLNIKYSIEGDPNEHMTCIYDF